MSTGDQMYPCGHYVVGPQLLCPTCELAKAISHSASEQFSKAMQKAKSVIVREGAVYVLSEPERLDELPPRKDIPIYYEEAKAEIQKWKEDPHHIPILSHPLMNILRESDMPQPIPSDTPVKLVTVGLDGKSKWGIIKSQTGNVITVDGWHIDEEKPLMEELGFDGSRTGRLSSRESNLSNYPKAEGEPHCVGCGRELPIVYQDVKSILWQAYHLIPEEGSQYYCRRAAFYASKKIEAEMGGARSRLQLSETICAPTDSVARATTKYEPVPLSVIVGTRPHDIETVLKWYEESQRCNDDAKPRWSSKTQLEVFPNSREIWSNALRMKIQASEAKDKEKAQYSPHWDPYGCED